MKFKQLFILLTLLMGFSVNSLAQSVTPTILMDMIVVEMSPAHWATLKKQQFLWQDNPSYLIGLIEALNQKDKKGLAIVRSQVKANDGEPLVIVGNTAQTAIEKRAINSAHSLSVTPHVITNDQLNLLLQDQKKADHSAKTGGVAFQKIVSETIRVKNKQLTLVALAKQPYATQLIFVTPTILHEKN